MELFLVRVDAGFEMMDKLSIEHFCLHDLDIAPEGISLFRKEYILDTIVDYIE